MITRLTLVTILVSDQDEALHWFTEILGLKKLQDAKFGNGARWLVVAPQEQSDFGIVLQKPEPAEHGQERARLRTEQIGKGTTWVFRADNLDETYQTLSARGVKFLSPPKAQPWGKQAIFEDLYGNQYALMGH
jgi:catechol 2,3-dioxygenase-like lactoylglutathione lyase family enzyme